MPAIRLPLVIQAALLDAEELGPVLRTQECVQADVLDYCSSLRRAAIGDLLMRGTVGEFRNLLTQSANAYLEFLSSRADEAKCTGRSQPFFDAVGSGDMTRAMQIADRSRHTWHEGEEYEDDFLYFEILFHLLFPAQRGGKVEDLVDRYGRLLDGQADLRYDVVTALTAKKQQDFEVAIDAFLLAQKEDFEKRMAADTLDPDTAATDSRVSLEGIALIRTAMTLGLRTEDFYLLVPGATLH